MLRATQEHCARAIDPLRLAQRVLEKARLRRFDCGPSRAHFACRRPIREAFRNAAALAIQHCLLWANISFLIYNVDPALLGPAYFLVVLNVPAMVVVHILMIAYLLRHRSQPAVASPMVLFDARAASENLRRGLML